MYSLHEQINEIYGYLHGLWRYRWSALLISWIVAIAGWLFVYTLPDEYESSAAINIDTTSVMQPLLKGLSVEIDPQEEIDLMTRVLLSRENLLTVIRETDMDLEADTPELREKLLEKLAEEIELNNMGLGSSRYKPSNLYEINYRSHSAELAFKVVFNLLNSLIENTLDSGRLDTAKAEEFLNEQISDYEQRLIESEERLAAFKKQNVGFMPDEQGGYYARVRILQAKIDETSSELRLAKQRFSEISQQLSGERPIVSTGSYSSASATKLRELRAQLNNLLVQFTEEHPDVKAVRARMADLENNMEAGTVGNIGLGDGPAELNPVYQDLKVEESRARVDVGALQIKLSEQRQALAELEKSIDIIPQVEADLARLNRDYDITRERYMQLVERRESARMAQKVEQDSGELIFRIVDAPVVPLIPVGPKRPVYLALVFMLALAVGVAWTVFRFLLHPTFVDFKQMQKMLDLPVLGSIALQNSQEVQRHRRIHLSTFLLALLLMFASFIVAVIYAQQASVHLRMLVGALGS